MTGAGPWLAVAGVGALHGLNPATGWAFAAAWGVRADQRPRAWRALMPIAAGHAVSVALVALLATLGVVAQRGLLPWFAGAGPVLATAVHLSRCLPQRMRRATGPAVLTLGSLAMGIAHGAGMMLVPALVPLCLSASPAREITASGSMGLALAAVGVHMAAMLGVTAAMATLACRGWGAMARRAARMLRRVPAEGSDARRADGAMAGSTCRRAGPGSALFQDVRRRVEGAREMREHDARA